MKEINHKEEAISYLKSAERQTNHYQIINYCLPGILHGIIAIIENLEQNR